MWTKIPNPTLKMPKRREVPAIQRRGSNVLLLVLPVEMASGTRADVFVSDDGRIGFLLGEKGDYKVEAHNPRAKTRRVTIPSRVKLSAPPGTHDVSLTREGQMLVLDPASIRPH